MTTPAVGRHHTRPGTTFEIVIDTAEQTWKFGEWEGDEQNPATVTCLGTDRYRIECDLYYSPHGVFSMEITQPLERAIATFMAALKADTEFEMGLWS